MNKTRILVITAKDGSKTYCPQYKWFGLWRNFCTFDYSSMARCEYSDLDGAKKHIDKWNKNNELADQKTPSLKHFINYP